MSFFKNLWFGKPTPDPILQGYITDITALTGVMEDMRTKFATYCNSVVHVGTTGLDLADGIHKFNSKLRPGHQPSLSFAQVQYAFREQLRLRWARQFKEEAIYMFEHWYKQSEAQRNTIANYEIARQHCHHLKSQLAELHEQRARLVERNKNIPDPLEKDIQEANQQYQKYSKALESMRAAIVSNQQRLAGPQGQFVYFDRAFATLLEMQVALEREMRRVVAAYEPLIADARARAGAGGAAATATGGDGADSASAAGGSPLRRGSFVGEDDAFRAHLKEMAEFVVQTSLEKDDVTGATTSPQKRAQEVDAIISQFTPSAPPTPSAGGPPSGLGRLSLGGGAGADLDASFAASPRHSTRKKKRLSWGVNSGVSVADSPPHSAGMAGTGGASLVAQAIAEEPFEDDDDDTDAIVPPHAIAASAVAAAAAAADAAAAGAASPEKADTSHDGESHVRGRSRRSESVVDTEIDIDLFLEGHFPADDDEDMAGGAPFFANSMPARFSTGAAGGVSSGTDSYATPVKSSLPPLPSLTPNLSALADTVVDTPEEVLAKTAPWRHEAVLAAAGPSAPAAAAAAASKKKAAAAAHSTGDDDAKSATDSTSDAAAAAVPEDDEEIEWPPELIVCDIELKAWESRGGRRKPLRELLATLHLVLWPGVSWRVVPIATMSGWRGVSAVLSRAWAAAAPVAEAAKKELAAAAASGMSGGAAAALAAMGETAVGKKYLTALRIVGALALAAEAEAEDAIAATEQGAASP